MRAVNDYQAPLLRYAGAILRGHAAGAQDVVQEAFVRFHRELRNGQQVEHTSSWLYRVTHNLAVDVLRREKRFVRGDGAMAAMEQQTAVPDGTAARCRREACDLAVMELTELPEDQRQVLLLKVVQLHTLKEIGEILDMPISTVHYHLGLGLKELARRLKRKGAI